MVEQTPRLDLDTYSEGEAWDHTDTVEAVDEHSIVHGPISERPNEGEYDDELYHATDQNITWRWDGSASDWEYFSGQGSSGTPVPGTSHFEAASIGEVNSTLHVQGGEVLNDRMVAEDAKYVLGEGIITFNESIENDQTIVIEGQGKDRTTLQASGSEHLFYQEFTDLPDKSLVLRDLTLDFDNIAGSNTRFLRFVGEFGDVIFDGVRVQNLDLSNFDISALIEINGVVSSLQFTGSSEIRWDTVTNVPSDPSGDNFHIVFGECDNLTIGSEVIHIGPTWDGSTEELRGYRGTINDVAIVDGVFTDWDQYASFLDCGTERATVDIRATATNVGDADIFRAGAVVDGGGIYFRGAVNGTAAEGDRGFIVATSGNQPEIVHADVEVKGTRVPVEIRAGKVVNVNVSAVNSGSTSGFEEGRPALQINDKDAPIGSVRAAVNILNDGSRQLDPAIELLENNSNWDDATHILEGTARGYETTQVDDQTDSGTTINTDRLFG